MPNEVITAFSLVTIIGKFKMSDELVQLAKLADMSNCAVLVTDKGYRLDRHPTFLTFESTKTILQILAMYRVNFWNLNEICIEGFTSNGLMMERNFRVELANKSLLKSIAADLANFPDFSFLASAA
jgi:hypothetical protein